MLKGVISDGCEGPSESLEPCYIPCQNKDMMGLEEWSEWSPCDKDNQMHRTRRCTLERCLGPEVESVPCFDANRKIGKEKCIFKSIFKLCAHVFDNVHPSC